jgi:hypothetical protein
VRIDLRANGFVFTDQRNQIRVKASAIHRQLGKTALEARLGTFIRAEGLKTQTVAGYEKRPAFWHLDTSRLWEEYEAQRNLRETLREAKYQRLEIVKAQQVASVKAAAQAKRSVIKITMKGTGRRIAYAAVQSELRQGDGLVLARGIHG